MKRIFLRLLTLFSLFLGLGSCWLWLRGTQAGDEVALRYDRYRSDGRAAGDSLYLKSEKRVWLTFSRGHVGPFNGRLVWGYHLNADAGGGRPQWHYSRYRYPPYMGMDGYRAPVDESQMAGWGPLRWRDFRKPEQKQDEQFRSITVGVSHWLVAGLFFVLPLRRGFARLRDFRRASELATIMSKATDETFVTSTLGTYHDRITFSFFNVCGVLGMAVSVRNGSKGLPRVHENIAVDSVAVYKDQAPMGRGWLFLPELRV